jgi:hypothetical protein
MKMPGKNHRPVSAVTGGRRPFEAEVGYYAVIYDLAMTA